MENEFDLELQDLVQSRAASYALFARLFRQEISPELLDQLRNSRKAFAGTEAAGEGERLLDRYLEATAAMGRDQAVTELAADYAGLFLNASDHPAYPYESVFTSPEHLLMQQARDEVRQAYAAAGLGRSEDLHEPEDHIAFEMEFMGRLCDNTLKAIEQEDLAAARTHLQTQQQFLEKHLLVWVPAFSGEVVHNATTDFYRGVGALTRDFIRFEKETIELLIEGTGSAS